MMAWWNKRKQLKQARELVIHTRKLLRIHRDQLEPGQVRAIDAAAAEAAAAVAAKDASAAGTQTARLETTLEKAFPRPPHASLRENVEVLLVAVIVAMGVRTFFVQPFKIPTGSMQPTLYGIYPYRDDHRADAPLPYADGQPSLLAEVLGTIFEGRIYEPWGYRTRGDHIFVDKISYHFRRPNHGEVVV
jgi:signal peptidase I